MKRSTHDRKRILFFRLAASVLAFVFAAPIYACTVFVLTDGQRVLFCNNEDWTNLNTRIWFVPAGNGYYGCVYVGYDDGWARGGMNTQGLACDWVGGFMEKWQADAGTCVRGNPTQRMLESCATVEEVIAFFQKHHEPDFCRAKILVADRRGMSAIIGAQDGKLQIERSERSRGFGFAVATLYECLAEDPEPTVAHGASILRDCLQQGKYATKYSNVFDLKSGDIYLYQFHQHVDSMQLNLAVELDKGGHYFEMLHIHQQSSRAVLPLLINMERFFLDKFPPIMDLKPEITHHIRTVVEDAMYGRMHAEDYDPALWSSLSVMQNGVEEDLKRYGCLKSIALVECKNESHRRANRYRIEFENAILLIRFELDDQNRIVLLKSEGAERKPGADLGE